MYEQYTFADPTFLDRAVMVAGVDGGSSGDYGYTHADPAMDYAIVNYINGEHGWSEVTYFKNNTSIVPTGSNVTVGSSASGNSETVRSYYNRGAGWINYSAHGGSTGWGTPNFGNTHVNSMTNVQKFGVMIGNCCQTNMYGESTCFGEALLRKGNYCGAVGYIGGSDYTYWGEDFYWAVGVRSSIGPSMSMAYSSSNRGAYDYICHTHNEAYSQWAISQGELMYSGNMAVQSSNSSLKNYYWEIYHLMGDPSVMPYLTQADFASVTVLPTITYGSSTLSVTTEPYAYVVLTDALSHSLMASAFANASGSATLTLPATLTVGDYELAVTAQQHRVTFRSISVISPVGAYSMVTAVTPQGSLDAGTTRPCTVTVANAGNLPADNVVVHFTSQDPNLEITPDSRVIATLAAGATVNLNAAVSAAVSPTVADNTSVLLTATTSWDGCEAPSEVLLPYTLKAPTLNLTLGGDWTVLPGGNTTVTATITNTGHAALPSGTLVLESPTSMMTVNAANSSAFTLAAGGTVQRSFTVHADAQMETGYNFPLHLFLSGTLPIIDREEMMFVGNNNKETFENNQFHIEGWEQGEYPEYHWMIVNSDAYEGSYCARSYDYLTHNNLARMSISCTLEAADSVSFYYKVSSESGYDKFHFYIDSEDMLEKSGEEDWSRAAFALTAGTHTLEFVYAKDFSVSNGSDCAWIDNVVLPNNAHNVYFDNVELCAGQVYVVNNDTVNTSIVGNGTMQSVATDGSLHILNYTVNPAVIVYDTIDACDHYTFNDVDYNHSTTFSENIETEAGCDSVRNIRLNIHYSVSGAFFDTIEDGYYLWNDEMYTESGIYQQTFTSIYGCDSTMILMLTILSSSEGIEGIDDAKIAVYPTPTTGKVRLSEMVEEVQVYDMTGKMVLREHGVDAFDLTQKPHGTYVVKVLLKGRWVACRVVKQ